MLLVAVLTIARTRLDDYRAYERAAAQIMARHHGAIERVLVLAGDADDPLRELHVVRFADAAGFAAYRGDPALAALAALRATCILGTEVWPATEVDAPGA